MAPSDLSLAIASYEWQKAFDVVKSQPGLARVWSVRFGFFEGQKESTLVPLHEACFGGAPIGVAQAILEAYPEASQRYVELQNCCYTSFLMLSYDSSLPFLP